MKDTAQLPTGSWVIETSATTATITAGRDFLDAARRPAIRFHAHDVAWSGTDGTATSSITVKGSAAPAVADKMPSLIIGPTLDLTVSASATEPAEPERPTNTSEPEEP